MQVFIPENIVTIGVPLPDNPLKMTNAYLIRGTERHLLIDNGFNRPECKAALLDALHKLEIPLESLDFFITHAHADHNGLTPELIKSPKSKVWCSQADAKMVNSSVSDISYWSVLFDKYRQHGFSDEELSSMGSNHPARIYAMSRPLDFDITGHGETLHYGGYNLLVISVPGHTPGHLMLYEPQNGILFSGDHVLGNITPNISPWSEMPDPLGAYLQSLQRVSGIPVKLTLPGHRQAITDTAKRVEELCTHHHARILEIKEILKNGSMSAYKVAAHMHWAIRTKKQQESGANTEHAAWQDFPPAQKWFATGEALAHLLHMQATEKVAITKQSGTTLWRNLT